RFSRDWSSDVCSSDLALLAAMSIGILFEDNQHCVEYVNPAFLRMWLISEHEDLRGLPTRTVLERSTEHFVRPANASRYVLNVMKDRKSVVSGKSSRRG